MKIFHAQEALGAALHVTAAGGGGWYRPLPHALPLSWASAKLQNCNALWSNLTLFGSIFFLPCFLAAVRKPLETNLQVHFAHLFLTLFFASDQPLLLFQLFLFVTPSYIHCTVYTIWVLIILCPRQVRTLLCHRKQWSVIFVLPLYTSCLILFLLVSLRIVRQFGST